MNTLYAMLHALEPLSKLKRYIHQVVIVFNGETLSRYFLITPKLLPDLYFNERVRVLIIYNSDSVPTEMKPLQVYLDHAAANGVE